MRIDRKSPDYYVITPLERLPVDKITVLCRRRGKKLIGQVWPGSVANITALEARVFAEGLDQASDIAGKMDLPSTPAGVAEAIIAAPQIKRNNIYYYTIFPFERLSRTYTQVYRTRIDHEIFIYITCVSGLSAGDARAFAGAIRKAADIADLMSQPDYTGYWPELEKDPGS